MKHQILFTPFKVGHVTIKNRFCMAPMGNSIGFGAKGEFSQNGVDYLVERAKGGVGLIFTGAMMTDMQVDPFSPVEGLSPLYSPMNFRRTAIALNERVHSYGTKIFAQITMGLGRNYPGLHAPSELPVFFDPSQKSPALTKDDIKKKVDAMVQAAALMKASDFDGVEVHAMHWGYLLDQFALSITNHRTDEYGGSLENRLRVTKEIIEGIKQVCGSSFPVTMRLGLKSYIKGLFQASLTGEDEAGRTLEEGVEICKLLESYGYDALNVDAGIYDSFYYASPPMYQPKGFTLDLAKAAKKAVHIPILAGGSRIDDPDMCAKAIEEGKADAIVIGRALLADSHFPKKVESGKIEDIRPCIGCNACINRGLTTGDPLCAVNPTVLREAVYGLNKTVEPKKIVVVGGGVAGMEAARVAKMRGHDVSLYEKGDKLGGNLVPGATHSFKADMQRLIEWYQRALKNMNVPIHLNTELDVNAIKKMNPDVVFLAVGSTPVMLNFKGNDDPRVISCIDALLGKKKIGQRVVIVGGGQVGCEMAYEYAKEGKTVTLVEALDAVLSSGPAVPLMNKMMLNDLLDFHKVKVYTGHTLSSIDKNGAVIKSAKDDAAPIEIVADSVIISVGFKPVPTMAKDLYGSGFAVYEMGDGSKVGNVMTAVSDAYEIARSV